MILVSKGWPEIKMPPPAGFEITPYEAFSIVEESSKLSSKHKWVCYRDEKFYYLCDSFGLRITAENVMRLGVKVDGQTGSI
jgi:hypothetical protein